MFRVCAMLDKLGFELIDDVFDDKLFLGSGVLTFRRSPMASDTMLSGNARAISPTTPSTEYRMNLTFHPTIKLTKARQAMIARPAIATTTSPTAAAGPIPPDEVRMNGNPTIAIIVTAKRRKPMLFLLPFIVAFPIKQ
jgi:hypothetical protein